MGNNSETAYIDKKFGKFLIKNIPFHNDRINNSDRYKIQAITLWMEANEVYTFDYREWMNNEI